MPTYIQVIENLLRVRRDRLKQKPVLMSETARMLYNQEIAALEEALTAMRGQETDEPVIDVDAALAQLHELENVCPDILTTYCYPAALRALKPQPQMEVFATWILTTDPAEILQDEEADGFYISWGPDDSNQGIGFFSNDKGAKLNIEKHGEGWSVTLTAPSSGIEKEPEYWLSPSLPDQQTEAIAFGIREVGK